MARAGRKPTEFVRLPYRDYILKELFGGDVKKCKLTEAHKERFEQLSWEYFDDQPLSENREIAKRMGVESPCTMPKDELLRHMIAERWGMQYLATSAVLLAPVDMDKLSPEDELKLIEDNVHGDVIMGEHFEGIFDGNELGGALRVRKFLKTTGDIGVIRRLVNYHSIKPGDYVTGWGRYVKAVNFFCLFCVESVNGMPVSLPADKKMDAKRVERDENFKNYLAVRENLRVVEPRPRLILSDVDSATARLVNAFSPLALGYSLIISSENRYDYVEAFKELAHSLKEDRTIDQLITLCLEEPIEKPNDLTENEIYTTLEDDLDSANIVERVRCYAVSRAKSGQNVVILLSSLARVADEVAARRLISTAKSYANGGSVTVITFADRDDRTSHYFAVRLLATAELKITAHPFAGYFTVNVADCHSPAFELTEEDTAVKEKLKDVLAKNGEDYLTEVVLKGKSYLDIAKKILSGDEIRR